MLQLKISSNRNFIKQLFLTDTFDSFLLEEGTLKTANTYYIDGRINKDFFSEEEIQEQPLLKKTFSTWQSLRLQFFDLIKGKKTPLFFKFVLHLANPEILERPEVKSYVLTIKFNGNVVHLTTGISLHTFQLDKAPEQLWDSYMKKILSQKNIAYELDL